MDEFQFKQILHKLKQNKRFVMSFFILNYFELYLNFELI